ncbi:MAG: hypothetical protein BGO69_11890 [Bacteroidetes bacterium 46-16]|nr:MAG: hypothetical protein BGO69_11890 [Bacteroidetes bacterium 46-16]
MPKTRKRTITTMREIQTLKRIDKLFRQLERDKNLPTFGEHFALCVLLGTETCVNLRKMYPATYKKLRSELSASGCI